MSAVQRGVAFEQRSLRLLQAHLSMSLRRVGGKSDGGIDLLGWWWLPSAAESHRPSALPDANGILRRRLRILAQCKAEKKKFSPKYVREMEGVWHLHATRDTSPPSLLAHDVHPTVALLLSESPFSTATVLHVYRSNVPFLLIHLPSLSLSLDSDAASNSANDTKLGTVCPNPTLTHLVKPLTFSWERDPFAFTGPPTGTDMHIGGRPGLWWQGRKLQNWAPELPYSDAA